MGEFDSPTGLSPGIPPNRQEGPPPVQCQDGTLTTLEQTAIFVIETVRFIVLTGETLAPNVRMGCPGRVGFFGTDWYSVCPYRGGRFGNNLF
jgi:hypothetical protein